MASMAWPPRRTAGRGVEGRGLQSHPEGESTASPTSGTRTTPRSACSVRPRRPEGSRSRDPPPASGHRGTRREWRVHRHPRQSGADSVSTASPSRRLGNVFGVIGETASVPGAGHRCWCLGRFERGDGERSRRRHGTTQSSGDSAGVLGWALASSGTAAGVNGIASSRGRRGRLRSGGAVAQHRCARVRDGERLRRLLRGPGQSHWNPRCHRDPHEGRRQLQDRPPPRPRQQVPLAQLRREPGHEEHLRRGGGAGRQWRGDRRAARLVRGPEPRRPLPADADRRVRAAVRPLEGQVRAVLDRRAARPARR